MTKLGRIKAIVVTIFLVFFAMGVQAGIATELNATVAGIVVDNHGMTIHLTNQPAACSDGLLVKKADPAYDRWLALLLSAYTDSEGLTVQYEATDCRLHAVAEGSLLGS